MKTSLLEYFSESKDVSFSFREDLIPKNKNIRSMFIQTGIFQILCNRPVQQKKECKNVFFKILLMTALMKELFGKTMPEMRSI